MNENQLLNSALIGTPSGEVAPFRTHLTASQVQCLSRCAQGISIRFESSEIVNALIAGGYVKRGVAGVITVTGEGEQYLRTHAS